MQCHESAGRVGRAVAASAMLMLVSAAGHRLSAQPPIAPELTVTATNVRGSEGQVVFALFTQPTGFPADLSKAAYRGAAAPATARHTFTGLPAGRYVVVVFHDRNGNGAVDRNFVGLPKEPIGLSNHPRLAPPKPDFERAKVDVSGTHAVTINLTQLGG